LNLSAQSQYILIFIRKLNNRDIVNNQIGTSKVGDVNKDWNPNSGVPFSFHYIIYRDILLPSVLNCKLLILKNFCHT